MNYESKIENCKYIVKQLKKLEIDDAYLGFYFVVSIENILLNKEKEINSFYKDIYPIIAEMYDKNDCSIERDIRHYIHQLWLSGNKYRLYQLFGGIKPSCCKFIYTIKNYLIKQIA